MSQSSQLRSLRAAEQLISETATKMFARAKDEDVCQGRGGVSREGGGLDPGRWKGR